MKTIFTTGQVAKICKVAPRTVSKWFDSGRLRGYRIPGSQDRRIPREHLIRFLKEHGMPLGELEDEAMGKILLVGSDLTTRSSLNEKISNDDFKIEIAASGFEAGIQAESIHPDCVVVDFVMGREEALMIAQNLRRNTEFTETVLIGLLSDEDNASGFDRSVFHETFRKPFDAALLAERIRTLVNRRKQLAGETNERPRRSDHVEKTHHRTVFRDCPVVFCCAVVRLTVELAIDKLRILVPDSSCRCEELPWCP